MQIWGLGLFAIPLSISGTVLAENPQCGHLESLVFLSVHDITQGAHQYGKDWVTFGPLEASPVSGFWLLFTIDLIHYAFSKLENVSNLL